jgi:hypothetical protein
VERLVQRVRSDVMLHIRKEFDEFANLVAEGAAVRADSSDATRQVYRDAFQAKHGGATRRRYMICEYISGLPRNICRETQAFIYHVVCQFSSLSLSLSLSDFVCSTYTYI